LWWNFSRYFTYSSNINSSKSTFSYLSSNFFNCWGRDLIEIIILLKLINKITNKIKWFDLPSNLCSYIKGSLALESFVSHSIYIKKEMIFFRNFQKSVKFLLAHVADCCYRYPANSWLYSSFYSTKHSRIWLSLSNHKGLVRWLQLSEQIEWWTMRNLQTDVKMNFLNNEAQMELKLK